MLVLAGASVNAQTITEVFGSGTNQFSIDFVTIGNPGNTPAGWGGGSVSYLYNLGKYEVSTDAVRKANELGGLSISFSNLNPNKPASSISWLEAARFVNFLNTSKGANPAYKFDLNGNSQTWSITDSGYNANNPLRNSLAIFWLPSVDEFYKGGFSDRNGNWWEFATASNTIPTPVAGGVSPNSAVYYFQTGPADINNAGSASGWGTFAQQGNVGEWREDIMEGTKRFYDLSNYNNWEINTAAIAPTDSGDWRNGFRVASVPEPSSLSLLLAGGAVLMAGRRKKQD